MIQEDNPQLAEALRALGDAHDTMAIKMAVNPQGTTNPPQPPNQITVTANASGIHRVSIVDSNPRTRSVGYWHEWDTNSNFSNAQPTFLHAARQVSLALSMGATPVYHRVCAQYPDGQRSAWLIHGGPQHPTGVIDGASVPGPAPHTSTGSGTSSVPGYGSGRESFVSPPGQAGKSPKIF
jgi:hypothetical protein